MARSYIDLANSGVQQLHPYQPGKPVEALERELGISNSIKLASNENPLGPSPLALKAIADNADQVHFYPDGGGYDLSARIAKDYGLAPANVTLGNGSNDVLELVARAYLDPQHAAVFSQYSFAVYPIVVQAVGAEARIAPAYAEDHADMPLGHDPEALLDRIDERTRVVFIANPNNPTGTWLEPASLLGLISQIPDHVIVVLDLAYREYLEPGLQVDVAAWLQRFPNLLVTCTFSKIHALAGLRIGYGLSGPDIADVLNRVRQPFNTNLLAQAAALAALDDQAHIERSVAVNTAGKQMLQAELDAMGLKYLPSMGNFLAIDFQRPAMPLYDALLREGVIVRPVASYAMPDYLRVTVGTGSQNQRFIESLRRVL